MSVSDVMNTMMSQDATATMSADVTSGSQPSGTAGAKPMVKGVEDVMNLYDDYEDDSPAAKNGVALKEDKNTIADELNNTVPKELNSEEKTEEVKEESVPETSKEVINDSNKLPDMVKVKINGAETEVPLQDVINSYSGQQEIQRRFTEFDKSKKAFETEKKELVGMNDYVKQEIGDLRSSFDTLVSQYEKNGYMDKNPLEAVNQLLDKMGINSNLFERAVFEHQLPDYAKFFNMTDVERDAYYTKKENDYLRRKEQGFNDRDQQVKVREEHQRKDVELIKNAGLDSVKYDELQNELIEAGHKDLTADKVVEYAKQKPTLDKVVEIFNTLGADPIQDERSRTVFKILQEFPETSVDEILDAMDPKRAALKSAKILDAKAPKIARVSSAKGEDADLDEMLNYYKN
jgi:arsenate reductase-like glutaredoxin family protein